jgi:hypothetical protein
MHQAASVLIWLATFVVAAPSGRAVSSEPPPLPLSNHPQLFLDDHLVHSMTGLKRVLKQPVKHPANPVLVKEHPWEKRVIEIYGTVLHDPALDTFRCWYLGNEHKDGIPDNPEDPRTVEYYTCYAESDDGITWRKPMVGTDPFGTHIRHNIVIPGTHGFCVLPTPDDPDPERRYKGVGGAVFGTSPDGIHWTTHNWREAVGKNDTSSCVVRWKGEYLAYVRQQVDDPEWPGVMRGVGLSVSRDFETWTPKETVFTTDKKDGYPWVQPYGMAVAPYGDVLIGIVWMLRLDHVPGNNSLGDQDMQLVVSRDGRTWHRVADRATFLAPTPGTWDRGRVFPGTTMFVRDGLVHVYYTGVSTRHGEGWGEMGIGLATLPADRFVALEQESLGVEGILETHPLTFSGGELVANANVSAGGLRVGLLDQQGNVLPGFGAEESRFLPYDPLRYRVVWRSGGEERRLADAPIDGPIALRFALSSGELYAFQVIGRR